ncbi:N-acylglucosamine 2-epimerase family protein [Synechococcus sp. A18-25c]|uniref:AGE family epimerase/isomerase n=1 Tax=Synechococcus sp. A18-25c TaxID=1866938 RepID=UPI00164688D5|nr:AGE family epimerase/isomerase [Synechococcus sp. A18-25c]QNJ21227.1 N-acylglucosamine 2-epimerase family protein [Synechococcus sp. A18-25c]
MNNLTFTFSDLISGYVTSYNEAEKLIGIKTSDGREFEAKLTGNTYAKLSQNLGEDWPDRSGELHKLLVPGQMIFVYGTFFPENKVKFEVNYIVFAGDGKDQYRYADEPGWWIKQIDQIASSYCEWQFNAPTQDIDYNNYRTIINLTGGKEQEDYLQETDTISRMVYGMACAYMLTGKDLYLDAAEKGTEYLRDKMRFTDTDTGLIYWYHGQKVGSGGEEQKLLVSEFGDDYDCIPAYEQIYALAGPVQTYRITGDPQILHDAEKTVDLFDECFKDNEKGGYYSHIHAVTLSAHEASLGRNQAKKNWNSVGDHAPAYLINLWLATGEERYRTMLEETFDTITSHFPDYEESPFVQEKFFDDWSKDQTWGWQQNRAVVGHNLKIAWNLMRFYAEMGKDKYIDIAKKIASLMPKVGYDSQRFGWYDVVERVLGKDEKYHRYAWHDRKAWWQQEQGILAYLILQGHMPDNQEYKKYAEESAAFYNAFFLDNNDGGVYFNVLANGVPYLVGTERYKGSHSMSAYHSTELCFLSTIYIDLMIKKRPLNLYFKPMPNGFKDRLLRVAPDILPKDSLYISKCEIDGKEHSDYDSKTMTVRLPEADQRLKVKVTIETK